MDILAKDKPLRGQGSVKTLDQNNKLIRDAALPSETEERNRALLNAHIVKKRGLKQTALENALSADRLAWLVRYAGKRRTAYYAALSGWRTKLERYELQSLDKFDWRKREGNRNKGRQSIFDVQNDSLNVVGAFAEFFTAQAKNDLFGSSPWFTARPEGRADGELAQTLSKHAAWKLRQSNLVETYNEAVKLTTDLGTCFTKKTWLTVTDEYEEPVTTLVDAKTRKPIYTTTGEVIYAHDVILEEPSQPHMNSLLSLGQDLGENADISMALEQDSAALSGVQQTPANGMPIPSPVSEDMAGDTENFSLPASIRRFPEKDPETDLTHGHYEYSTAYRRVQRTVYRNVKAFNLHYKDVAFDPLAPCLDLAHTDFFHSFTKNLNDIRRDYQISEEDARRIHHSLSEQAEARKPQSHLEENQVETEAFEELSGTLPNIPVRLIEGYLRVDITGRQQQAPANVYIVFCPEIDLILKVDYLANTTPGGDLPVHAHTIERLPYRIVGRGFFEHLELAQTMVDDAFNRINWHDRKRSNPLTGLDKSQLMQEDEDEDAPFNDERPVNLKPDARLDHYIQFKDYPDLSSRTSEMLHLVTQMVQLRKGITAASQGDLTGSPETNTATGIRQLISRSAVLLKCPIDDLKRSFTRDLLYTVKLLYENFDRDEAFVYGEGESMQLMELREEQVRDLEIDIEILLTQAQNQFKLENARAGIELFNAYSQLPEVEKQHGRTLWMQALRALDFADADQIIRPASVDMESAMSILPPEVQQQLMQIMQGGEQGQEPEQGQEQGEGEIPTGDAMAESGEGAQSIIHNL